MREAWRKGRERYAVFLVEIEDTEIVERMERVRQALAGRLSPMPRPHLNKASPTPVAIPAPVLLEPLAEATLIGTGCLAW